MMLLISMPWYSDRPKTFWNRRAVLRGMAALADDDGLAFQAVGSFQEAVEDLLQIRVAVEKPVIDGVEVLRADCPACPGGMKRLCDAQEGIRLHDVVAHRSGKEKLSAFHVAGDGDGDACLVPQLLFEKIEGIYEGRLGNGGRIAYLAELRPGAHGHIRGDETEPLQYNPADPRDQGIIDGQRAVDAAAPAHGAPVEGVHHVVDVLLRKRLCPHELAEELSRGGEVFLVYLPEQIGPPGGQIPLIPRGLIDLALLGAVVALGAGAEIRLQGQVVDLRSQDLLEGLEKTHHPFLARKELLAAVGVFGVCLLALLVLFGHICSAVILSAS